MNLLKTVLVVDDEPRTRDGVKKTLETDLSGAVRVITAGSAAEASRVLEQEQVHLLITDIRMPEITGLTLVEDAQAKGASPVVIIISGHAVFEYAHHAIRLGVFQYLLKPLEKRKLLETVEQALKLDQTRHRQQAMERMVDKSLLELQESGEGRIGEPVLKAMRYVESHLQAPLGLREVAEEVHLNASYFSFLFKEQTGLTFLEYVTRCKLQKAKELLLGTALPIGEIAVQVGYLTPKYFIKLFKENTGVSPSQYRKQMAGDNGPI
jgi:YesN/AraC family two-component response regulator